MRKNSLALALIRSELCRAFASAAAKPQLKSAKPHSLSGEPPVPERSGAAPGLALSFWLAARRRHERKRARL